MQTAAAAADKDEEASGGEERCPDILPACRHPAKPADVKDWQQVMNGDEQENNTGATRVWTTNEIMPQRNNCTPGSLLALLLGLCTKLASLLSRLPPSPYSLLPSSGNFAVVLLPTYARYSTIVGFCQSSQL